MFTVAALMKSSRDWLGGRDGICIVLKARKGTCVDH
jgi:hypothetical protein